MRIKVPVLYRIKELEKENLRLRDCARVDRDAIEGLGVSLDAANKEVSDLREENKKLKEEVAELKSPRYAAELRAKIEGERITAARRELEAELPPEVAKMVDWSQVEGWL